MNLRSLLFRAALAVAFLAFALVAAVLVPRDDLEPRAANTHLTPVILFPLIALPLLHAISSP